MWMTTLNKIQSNYPDSKDFGKLLKRLGKNEVDDEPLSIIEILDSTDFDNAVWCLRAVDGHDPEIRLFAVWCARRVQHRAKGWPIFNALDVAERHANGLVSDQELFAAKDAAECAEATISASGDTASCAAYAACASAAASAPWCAARLASWAAVSSAGDEWGIEKSAQQLKLREMAK